MVKATARVIASLPIVIVIFVLVELYRSISFACFSVSFFIVFDLLHGNLNLLLKAGIRD